MYPSRMMLGAVLATLVLLVSCASTTTQRRASSLEFLYPQGVPAQPPTDVTLNLPLRVGIAFPPPPATKDRQPAESFDESQKRALLERVAAAFRDRPEIARVEVIPTFDLKPDGGFENLDQLAKMYGLDVFALVSYEQVQFDETTKASITYWTIVGAYLIQGNRNETRTVMDASVFDIPSRALLFRASGTSTLQGSATAIDSPRELREAGAKGFEEATTMLIADLDRMLAGFREQAKSGTVRGAGTSAVTVTDSAGGGVGGAGAVGVIELAAAILFAAGAALLSRRRAV
ncbi:MAG: rhombotarget lipoprotein [Steroidobacteraceae bacterium]